jgi:hypothetical protein
MLSRGFRSRRPLLTALAGVFATMGALGAFAVTSASSAMAAPPGHAVSVQARHQVKAPTRILVPAAETSSFVAFSGTSMTGTSRDINGCGVHNMPFAVRSYRWIHRGQSGRMYNCANAGCAVNFVLASNADSSSPNPVGWKSIDIIC